MNSNPLRKIVSYVPQPPFPLGLVHHTQKGLSNLASYVKRLTALALHLISWASVPFCPRQTGVSWDALVSFLVTMLTILMTLNVSLQKMRNMPYLIPHLHGASLLNNHHTWAVSIMNILWESPWIQALPPIWCPKVSLPALISPSNLHLSLHARLMVMHPLMWSVKSVVHFIAATATSALMLWLWGNWMSMSSRAIPFWLSMTLRHVLQNSRWLWEVKTLSAMEPLQHAMCLSGKPYCSECHQNKEWLCLGITLHSHWPVSCLQMTNGHWNHVWTARSMPSLTHLRHGPHHRKSLQLATNSVWSTQPEVLSIYVALGMCARFML